MKTLRFRFIKRFIIAPVLITVFIIAIVGFKVPESIDASVANFRESAQSSVDISEYNIVDFDEFSDLSIGDYVATMSINSINLTTAVLYNTSSEKNAVGLTKYSKEPWKKGSVGIIGENSYSKFKKLHNARVGTEININFYKNAVCNYKITKITYNNSDKDIIKKLKSADLILCVAYVDFHDPETSLLYTVYEAELGGIELWK